VQDSLFTQQTDVELHEARKDPAKKEAAETELIHRINKPVVTATDRDLIKQRRIAESLRKEL